MLESDAVTILIAALDFLPRFNQVSDRNILSDTINNIVKHFARERRFAEPNVSTQYLVVINADVLNNANLFAWVVIQQQRRGTATEKIRLDS